MTEHEFPVSADLADAVTRLAQTLSVEVDTVLLGVHAVVVGVLSGEQQVQRTWREVITHVARRPADDDAIVHIGLRRNRDGWLLAMRCRQDSVDAEHATRIADYHRTGLRLAAADPDAEHGRQCLLGEAELRYQLEELSGPPRELPDRRVHELVADMAAAAPDAVAVVLGEDRLTYRELDERANQVANALLADGLRAEDVVGVVTERNIPWLVAVLAVLKAGGCYLPVEPHFPAERIAAMFTRSACRLVLTDQVGRGVLDRLSATMPGLRAHSVETLLRQAHPALDPGVAVTADRLAYIYFTSGSTGEPKGVMCEHEGMLNHMLAKIDDLGIRAGTVVAQTAPQCFDISLWQLIAPLLVGGTVVIVPQQALLDVEQFVGELARGRVEVAQLVPSYVEVLLAQLEQRPRELPALRCVSATGEALKAALVRRWFDCLPDVLLVNAYGLTETCDDTNHELMDRAPDGSRVSLGRTVPGAEVYVVDQNLMPVPLGATGEIVFSGRCLARGYVNDPVRTAAAFTASPHHPGRRLYRSGDFGRWTPDGRLEFAGRKDTQVKIRGFRIEIEEIEDRLLRVPGVREAAVIVMGAQEREQRLVACYSAPPALPVAHMVDALSKNLPDYMVPMDWYWLDVLPLTGNGKVDRKELARITARLHGTTVAVEPPATDAERKLAAAWATVLGLTPDQVGRTDDFFASGGSSLSALKLVIALDRTISLGDVTGHPVLADLAEIIAGSAAGAHGRLYRLSQSDEPSRGVLVCFPYAGGNAMNYLPLATRLRGSGWAVHAVEPPGRGPVAEPLAEVPELAKQVVAELAELDAGPVLVWGHSLGAAAALETARLLRQQGQDVRRVFLGAQLPGDPTERRAQISEVRDLSDREIVGRLAADSGRPELAEVGAGHLGVLAAAYRHDVAAACRYLVDATGHPPLDVPVTVVLADDDPDETGDPADWTRFAEDVRVHRLADGGHYFPATRPAEVARIITEGETP